MGTLNDYFRTEARDFLVALERGLHRTPAPDAAELHRAVRGLRGTAQMAREQRIFDVVSAFESVTRSLAGGALAWSDDVAQRARDTIGDLRVLLDRTEDDEQLDARVSSAAARWRQTAGAAAMPVGPAPHPAADSGTSEFREFAAREAAGIADVLDRGVQDLQADPMDREPLKNILRRQRALLGAARLDEIPVVAEILRAVEDLTRVIAKLDVGVKREWLDIYRVARDGLQSTIAPLLRDEPPEPSHAVSRLRHMHKELLERYGSGEAGTDAKPSGFIDLAPDVSHPPAAEPVAHAPVEQPPVEQPPVAQPPVTPPAAQAMAPQPVAPFSSRMPAPVTASPRPAAAPPAASGTGDAAAVLETPSMESASEAAAAESEDELLELDEGSVIDGAGTDGDFVEIGALSYTREEALNRALELHDAIVRAVGGDQHARDAVEELFDLIRIARG